MLTALTAGMSPVCGVVDGITQVALMGVFRFISLFYLNDFWNIVKRCADEKKRDEMERMRRHKTRRSGNASREESVSRP
jgi:hypothetical protein